MGLFKKTKDDTGKKPVQKGTVKLEKGMKKSRPPRRSRETKGKKNGFSLAIELGSNNIKFAVGGLRSGKIHVQNLFKADMENLNPQASILQNARDLENKIKLSLSKNGVKTKDCIVTIESADIIKREMSIPELPYEDALSMISYEMERYLSINPEDFIIQYKILEMVEEEGQMKQNILVGVLPKSISDTLYTMLKNIGLNPLVLDVNSNSLQNLFEDEKNTTALIDIGYDNINVTLINQGQYKFNRILKMGSSGINKEIARNCGVSEAEAKEMHMSLRNQNIMEMGEAYEDKIREIRMLPQEEKVAASYIKQLNIWVNEIDKVFKYFTTRSANNTIDRIYIYGGEASFNGIENYIGNKLGKTTDIMGHSDKVVFASPNMAAEMSFYLNVISSLGRQ